MPRQCHVIAQSVPCLCLADALSVPHPWSSVPCPCHVGGAILVPQFGASCQCYVLALSVGFMFVPCPLPCQVPCQVPCQSPVSISYQRHVTIHIKCHVIVVPCVPCHVNAMSMSSPCRVIAVIAMSLPSQCQVNAMSMPRQCRVIVMSMPCDGTVCAMSVPPRLCPVNVVSLSMLVPVGAL